MTESIAAPGPAPLIVYVDDERPNRVVFEQSLKAEFNIQCFEDGHAALAFLADHDVAVVITDMRMPAINGDELLRIVKERHPRVIRMVITAFSDVDPILRAINEGLVARYIIKPWVRTEIVQVLRWAVEAWRFSRDSGALHQRLLETERLATLGSVSGMLIHDLRQPLLSLMMNVEHLQELATFAPQLAQALQYVELGEGRDQLTALVGDLGPITTDLKTSIDHLSSVLNGLREFSRPRKPGDGPPSTDPMPILRHAMAVCQELAVTLHASIEYRGPQALPKVRISATELTQVLINVLANGTQAIGARGAGAGTVSIAVRTDAKMLELQIRDDGVGMTPEVLARVGTPFFTTRQEGTGLGVAQCHRLVGNAGGGVVIDSVLGKGTTVTITLPITA